MVKESDSVKLARAKYRSQAGIVYDILETLYREEIAPPTRLMYGARIPYDRLKNILKQLVENKLVEEIVEGDRTFYRITGKGVEALEELRRVKRILEQIGIRF